MKKVYYYRAYQCYRSVTTKCV